MKSLDMQYDNVCTACEAKLSKGNIAFSELDLLPYHKNMTSCNRKHPNSYENHAKRNGRMIVMLTIAEAQQEWRKRRLQALDSSDVESVMKLLKGPTTLRVDTVENAAYIVDLANEKELSISETIRTIITDHREQSGKKPVEFVDTPVTNIDYGDAEIVDTRKDEILHSDDVDSEQYSQPDSMDTSDDLNNF